MSARSRSFLPSAAALAAAFAAAACAVHPAGEAEERERAAAALRELDEPAELPPLPGEPSLRDCLRTAFHADAELRARYWEWRAAIERIPQEASPPNPAFSFSHLFSNERMSAWDRTTLGLSNDPMSNLPFPAKLATAGRRALAEAVAAGRRFEAAKFNLQAEVTSLYLDLALHGEQIRAQEETVALLRLAAADAGSRLRAGRAAPEEALRAQDEVDRALNVLESLHAQLPVLAARMNVRLGRDARAPLPLPRELPDPVPLAAPDDEIIALAAQRSPELEALAHEVAGREDALELARQAWIPDFGLGFGLTGSVARSLGGMVVLPLRAEAIEAGIEEARARLRAAEAEREKYARDLAASFVLDLVILHDTERQVELFRDLLVPRAGTVARTAESSQATGRGTLADVVMARRAEVDARFMLAQLRAEREKALAAIESWSSLDVEALHMVRMGPAMGR